MTSESQYQGSQAYAANVPSEESVSPNSGSVGFSKTLLIFVEKHPTSDCSSSFDPNWADQDGWKSGLKYVNNHGMLFEHVFPAEPLPSNRPNRPGDYEWRFKTIDGSTEYFDPYGKLIEHSDLYGNSIYFSYVDDLAGPMTAKVDYILDSWDQKISFEYDLDGAMYLHAPDGGQTKVEFGTHGVESIEDPMGYITAFTYIPLAGQTLIDTITFPSGLQSKFDYTMLSALDGDGIPFSIPACSYHLHQDIHENKLMETQYEYGVDTGFANFTGAAIGCRMQSSHDSLMESENQDYRYDVTITRLDTKGEARQMSRVYYNYLHLPMQEDHYHVDTQGKGTFSHRTINSYDIPMDHHARSTTYSQPIQVDQLHYSESDFKLLRRAASTYDAFGCPLIMTEWMWDKQKNKLVMQKSVTSTYKITAWGGELLETETYTDHIASREKRITYRLTSDERNIASSTVTYRDDGSAKWMPWKTKSYVYDDVGRVKEESVAWSDGATFPEESVKQYTYKKAHSFDPQTGLYNETTTDPLGNAGTMSYDMRIKGGPLVIKLSPLGSRETMKYDLSGRIVETTDALGATVKTSYFIGLGQNFAQNVTSTGYITCTNYDVLGRKTAIRDSGNRAGTKADRILSRSEYDALSRLVKSTNEIGLVITKEYDDLNRVTKYIDVYGNSTTYEYNDSELTAELKVNGDLRSKTFTDALGRQIKSITYGDSAAEGNSYKLVAERSYDAFGNVTSSRKLQQSLDDSQSILLAQVDFVYDVEGNSRKVTSSAISSDLSGEPDKVLREYNIDIFGNSVTYKKTVSYADGRQFICDGPLSIFDACNRMVKLRNQFGQIENNEFDAEGHLIAMTRYDGTKHTYTYDKLGHMIMSTSPEGSRVYEYLPNGRLASVAKDGEKVKHTYASDGCIMSTEYPNGRKQMYVIDETSRVIQETDVAGCATENSFDAYGRLVSKKMKDSKIVYNFGTVNHVESQLVGTSVSGSQSYHRSIKYDGFGRQVNTTDRDLEGKVILNSVYLYDSRGRLLAHELRSEQDPQASSINQKEQFQYDGFGQLVSHSTEYGRDLAPPQTKLFRYDGNFNIIQKVTDGVLESFTYNALDQRKDPGFAYDGNGRLVQGAADRLYKYDSEDKLISVTHSTTTTYSYNPDESLATISRAAGTSSFYYSGGAVNSSQDVTEDHSTWTSYLLEPKGRVAAEVEGKGTPYFLESRNSVKMTLNSSGSSTHHYEAYGEESSSNEKSRFGWQQELGDDSTGLTYLRSRFYQSSNMAFITMDGSRKQENRAATVGAIAGMVVGAVVTVASGGTLSWLGFSFTGLSLTAMGVGAATISGALGTLAGDATAAAITGESFTAARAGEDLLVDAIGGAVGAGVGGAASSSAMRMAMSAKWSVQVISRLGTATSAVLGGGSGSFASAATSAGIHHQPLFSLGTAYAAITGMLAGAGGAFLHGGACLAYGDIHTLPVELTAAEIALGGEGNTIVPGRVPSERFGDHKVYNMTEPLENGAQFCLHDTSRILPTSQNGPNHRTIIVHGDAGRLYATVKYGNQIVHRPIKPTLLAEQARIFFSQAPLDHGWSNDIKLLSCRGGWSNAQKIADYLGENVWASYINVSTTEEFLVADWKLYRAPYL
ncbi:hypothetical protein TWF788_009372 [Orbilia oligospora]|uniref:Teneurin-like YD-shell domain-containing protein n=1 Tax=Orbilia oligospora TaxID=2813651 RepID=A0A7C8KFU1_ORBOL|nr:hypothetical protein TWF788_009372 [Orbilia oligospora]